MEIKTNIPDLLIVDMLVTAFEGGSNYWATLGFVDRTHFVKGNSLAENVARSVLADKNYKLDVYDVESDEDEPELLGTMTYASIEKAFNIMANEYPEAYRNIITENYDADDADIFFQLAVMGELVFG